MAWYDNCRTITGIAGTAVTIYRFVALAADGQMDHVASAQGDVDGIAGESQATVGRDFPVVLPDGALCKVEAGAAVAVGALVSSDASGRAITHVAAVDNVAVGRAWSAASAAGDIITIQFVHKRTDAGT